MKGNRILRASPYYWEKVMGKNLAERHTQGKLSFMLLNQPPLCDAHCRRCFMPPERRVLDAKTALTQKEWFAVLNEGRGRGLLSIEISGEGEPLLSGDTIQIIRHARSIGVLATLITNGHALTEQLTRELFEQDVTLVLSLHTLDRRKYEHDNQCPESFRKKMGAIDKAAEIFRGSPYAENDYLVQRLAVHTTLQADNLDELEGIRDFCYERGLFFSVAPLANTGNAVFHPELRVRGLIEDVTALGDNSIIHSATSASIYGREVCGTAAFGMSIGFDGNLLLDAHGGYEIGGALGNVTETDFDDLFATWREAVGKMFHTIQGFCPVRDAERFGKFVAGLKTA